MCSACASTSTARGRTGPMEPAPSPLSAPKNENTSNGWLPNRVEIGKATIHDTQLTWSGGGLRGTAFEIAPSDGGWQVTGQGGRITYGALPPLDVDNLHLRYRAPSLFVNGAELRQPGGGSLQATGEVDFTRQLDLRLALTNVAITPYLSEDWRLRAKGNLSGDVTVHSALPARGSPQLSGSLKISQGELTALPVLDQIAEFTRSQQFRRLNLNEASGDFTQDDSGLRVKNFVAESDGLIRVEGNFTIVNGMIDGTFQVGVTPSSLQWLPGSQTKVFTEARGGYVWSPMHLTGPANKPDEDLSKRLIAAAQGAAIEAVQDAAGQAVKTGKDAVKSALDLLLPPYEIGSGHFPWALLGPGPEARSQIQGERARPERWFQRPAETHFGQRGGNKARWFRKTHQGKSAQAGRLRKHSRRARSPKPSLPHSALMPTVDRMDRIRRVRSACRIARNNKSTEGTNSDTLRSHEILPGLFEEACCSRRSCGFAALRLFQSTTRRGAGEPAQE